MGMEYRCTGVGLVYLHRCTLAISAGPRSTSVNAEMGCGTPSPVACAPAPLRCLEPSLRHAQCKPPIGASAGALTMLINTPELGYCDSYDPWQNIPQTASWNSSEMESNDTQGAPPLGCPRKHRSRYRCCLQRRFGPPLPSAPHQLQRGPPRGTRRRRRPSLLMATLPNSLVLPACLCEHAQRLK